MPTLAAFIPPITAHNLLVKANAPSLRTQAVPHAPHSAGVGLSEAAGHGARPAPELWQVSGRRPAQAHGRRMSECGGQPATLKPVSPRTDLQGAVILPPTRIPVQHSARGFLPSCAQWPPPHPFSRPAIFNPPPPGGKQDGCFARYKSMCTNADKIADTALHLRLPAEGAQVHSRAKNGGKKWPWDRSRRDPARQHHHSKRKGILVQRVNTRFEAAGRSIYPLLLRQVPWWPPGRPGTWP